jgi:hypothetical protein
LRYECLNVETFLDLTDVREKLKSWRQHYNQATDPNPQPLLSPSEDVKSRAEKPSTDK